MSGSRLAASYRNLTASMAFVGLLIGYPVIAGDTAYQYDALGRVTQALYPDGTLITYQYDKAGNRIQTRKSPPVTINVTSGGANLRTLANNAGYTGTAGARYQFFVTSGLTLRGSAGGGKGVDTGTWPSDAVLSLVVSGNLYGGGGNGGAGSSTGAGSGGGAGGDALYVQAPISVVISASGSLKAGGGGGGGAGYGAGNGSGTIGGDGGGGGFPNGTGGGGTAGTSGDAAVAGAIGTDTGGGAGGSSGAPGGAGGNAGLAGSSGTTSTGAGGTGGATGYAIRKNSYTVTVTNNGGTLTGTVN